MASEDHDPVTALAEEDEHPPPSPEPDKPPERKIFKGDVKTLSQLLGLKDAMVQLLDRQDRNGRKVPGLAQINLVNRGYYPGTATVQMLDRRSGWVRRVYDLPVSTKVNVLSGRMAEEMRAELKIKQKASLGKDVQSYGYTMGCDPEVFVTKGDTEEIIPAWEFLGSKEKPGYTKGNGDTNYDGNPVYWDGFQAEFTTTSNVSCLGWMFDSVHNGMYSVITAARAKFKDAHLSIHSVLPVADEVLQAAKPEHVAFGCTPSKNAYGLSGRNLDGRDCPVRFAGGHIHFGLQEYGGDIKRLHKDEALQRRIMFSLDSILGVACVSLFQKLDNPIRRDYYGLPGEYRLPPHGLEYRTLSNGWLCHPLVGNMVFELARRAFDIGWYDQGHLWEATEGEVLDCILRCDAEVARAILKRNMDVLSNLLQYRLGPTGAECARLFLQPVDEFIKNPGDLAGNWKCNKARWTRHCGDTGAYWGSASAANVAGGNKM